MIRQRALSALIGVVVLMVGMVVPMSSRGSTLLGAGDRSDFQRVGGGLLRYARNDRGVVPADVWAAAASDGAVDILVVLRDGADLTAVPDGLDRVARGEQVYDALWQAAGKAQRALRADLDAAGIAYRPFYLVNAIQVRADEALLRVLATRPDVARIVPNTPVPGIPRGEGTLPATAPQGIEPNLLRIHAADVWALGYTGEGMVVAGQDTGYDWEHPALMAQYRGWDGSTATHDYHWHDAIHGDDSHTAPGNSCGFDSPVPCDDHGHGTHTMGTIIGDDGGANQIGVAPGARWIACRNMEEGWGTPATYLECFEFFLAPYPVGGTPAEGVPALAPHVVNNSWGCPPEEGCDQAAIDLIDQAVSALRQAGIVVVASAGNNGSACETVIHPPAIARDAVSVAAFDDVSGAIASFSSRGPVTDALGAHQKPDLAAPGVGVRSSLPGGIYGNMSGTSMAAPHVAGAVALLLSAAPAYMGDVGLIESALTSTAVPRTTSQGCGGDGPDSVPNNVWGWGELDVLAAVELARSGGVTGLIVDAVAGTPVAGADVVARLEGTGSIEGTTYTDASGAFALTLPVGAYGLTVDAQGYAATVKTDVQIMTHETLVLERMMLVPVPTYYLPLIVVP
ncbi:MAG: S8 family serine peptidase [Anaerolineae bacterium]|nr:S8 family serine peptidase [Anaerolineae bacterium]